MSRIVFICIAGLHIKLIFKVPQLLNNTNQENRLEKEIMIRYESFIYNEKIRKSELDIIITPHSIIRYQKNIKGLLTNFLFFYEDGGHQIITSAYLSIDQFNILLTSQIHRLLVKHGGFILHASANLLDNNNAIIFVGKSSIGKSTIMTYLHSNFPAIADESVIIIKERQNFYLFQTPFIEKNNWVSKTQNRFNIKSVCFLKQAPQLLQKKINSKKVIFNNLVKSLVLNKNEINDKATLIFQFTNQNDFFYNLEVPKNRDTLVQHFKTSNS